MIEEGKIINKVSQKNIVLVDLQDYLPKADSIEVIDIKDFLFKELVLKENDFREIVKTTDWSKYKDKFVGITCSSKAIVPYWAYMVLGAEISQFAKDVAFAPADHLISIFLYRAIEKMSLEEFEDRRIIIKGCGDKKIDEAAYVYATQRLASVAKAIMYGEACSTVPVFKK